MKLLAAGLTDPGKVRKNNEDNYWVDEALGFMMVADGMGGHAAGEVASQMAVEVVRDQVAQGLKTGRIPALGKKPAGRSDRAHLLAMALEAANEVISAAAQKNPERRGMGTTAVAALADGNGLAVAHAGDSRCYLFRGGRLRQLTQDHSLVEEQIAKGLLTAEQAARSDMKNVLTRALGAAPEVEVDASDHALAAGDVMLLCSDGLSRMAEDDVIARHLAGLSDPVKICHDLVSLAVERGGKDNVTVVTGVASPVGVMEKLSGIFGRWSHRKVTEHLAR